MPVRHYFTDFTVTKALFYGIAILYVFVVCIIVTIEPFLSLPCVDEVSTVKHLNPDFVASSCLHMRFAQLLFMTPMECDLGRRLMWSLFLGAIIGWERRQADRPAGIRTMSLVALGSSLFTICSTFAFLHGPMEWDASRISAAIPSGVGFLGEEIHDVQYSSHILYCITLL